MSEAKGRVDDRTWKKSEEILLLLLGWKDEGTLLSKDGGKGI